MFHSLPTNKVFVDMLTNPEYAYLILVLPDFCNHVFKSLFSKLDSSNVETYTKQVSSTLSTL